MKPRNQCRGASPGLNLPLLMECTGPDPARLYPDRTLKAARIFIEDLKMREIAELDGTKWVVFYLEWDRGCEEIAERFVSGIHDYKVEFRYHGEYYGPPGIHEKTISARNISEAEDTYNWKYGTIGEHGHTTSAAKLVSIKLIGGR